MPGDELVPGCQYRCTRAITIDAPPSEVWPWLVQVGFGKAGFYSNDLLDNVAHPSATAILDEFQHPSVGRLGPDVQQGERHDRVQGRGDRAVLGARLAQARQHLVVEAQRPVDGGTRLVTRLRILYRWEQPLGALALARSSTSSATSR